MHKYIATVPTVWDTTISLAGEIGKYVAIARKSGEDWYIGAMTNWDSRTIEIDFLSWKRAFMRLIYLKMV